MKDLDLIIWIYWQHFLCMHGVGKRYSKFISLGPYSLFFLVTWLLKKMCLCDWFYMTRDCILLLHLVLLLPLIEYLCHYFCFVSSFLRPNKIFIRVVIFWYVCTFHHIFCCLNKMMELKLFWLEYYHIHFPLYNCHTCKALKNTWPLLGCRPGVKSVD